MQISAPLEAWVQQTPEQRKDVVRNAIRTRNYWIPLHAHFNGVAGQTSTDYSSVINQDMSIFGATTDLAASRAMLTVVQQQYSATQVPIVALAGRYSSGDTIRPFAHPIALPSGQQVQMDFTNSTLNPETNGTVTLFAQETRTFSDQDVDRKAKLAFENIDKNVIELDFDLVMDFDPTSLVNGQCIGATLPFDRPLLIYGASVESQLLDAANIPLGTIQDDQTRENWSQVPVPMWSFGGINSGYAPIMRYPVPIFLPERARLYGTFSPPTSAGAITFKAKTA